MGGGGGGGGPKYEYMSISQLEDLHLPQLIIVVIDLRLNDLDQSLHLRE